jgi:hypothetical protein
MKHFLYFGSYGYLGNVLGHLYEVRQSKPGWGAYLHEDYKSNYYGTVFRDRYYTDDNNLQVAFNNFFNDLGAKKISYWTCK